MPLECTEGGARSLVFSANFARAPFLNALGEVGGAGTNFGLTIWAADLFGGVGAEIFIAFVAFICWEKGPRIALLIAVALAVGRCCVAAAAAAASVAGKDVFISRAPAICLISFAWPDYKCCCSSVLERLTKTYVWIPPVGLVKKLP